MSNDEVKRLSTWSISAMPEHAVAADVRVVLVRLAKLEHVANKARELVSWEDPYGELQLPKAGLESAFDWLDGDNQ